MLHSFVLRFAALSISILVGTTGAAHALTWSSHGPDGGTTGALGIDPSNPSTLYAATFGGMFKTTDGGASWNNAGVGFAHDDNVPTAIVVDPSDSNVAYAMVPLQGVFKTVNGGASWIPSNTGLPFATPFWTIAIDPHTPATLYAGVYPGGVYKSTDAAATWNPANTGLPPTAQPYAIVVDADTPTTVYVGMFGDGVYKSADGGASWNPANNGLTNTLVLTMAASPDDPARLYVGTFGGGVFRSNSGGNSWNDFNGGLADLNAFGIAVDPTDATEVYANTGLGVFKSSNSGAHWTPAGTGLPWSYAPLAIDPSNPRTIYAATSAGVFKTTNKTSSWSPSSSGLAAAEVRAIAVDPVSPTTVYAATYGQGVFKSTDGTASWSAASTGLANPNVFDVAIDPVTVATLYAAHGNGVSKSVDGGASWSDANVGLSGGAFSLVIDPATPSTLYVVATLGVRKSTNGAGSWSPATDLPGNVTQLVIDPLTPATLYAATIGGGVFQTVDGAASWNPMNTGLTNLNVLALAIDPVTPTTLYAGTSGGLFTSTNGATSWTGPVLGAVIALAVDPTTPTTVYAGTYGSGVLRSTDGGGLWLPTNDGLTSLVVESLTVGPTGTALAGTIGGGVFLLHDCGNGTTEVGEECDDGNLGSGDGCSATCVLEPCSQNPMPICRVAQRAQLQVSEKNPGKERLKVQWKKIAGVSTLPAFGDPIGGTTRVIVCLYDDAKALIQGYEVDRAGQQCGTKPCWSAKGTNGYGYKDSVAASDGITKMSYKSGATLKGKADVAGANNAAKSQTALPTGVIPNLTGNTTPTVQLITSDGLCVGATMREATKDEGGQYKARK